MEPLGNLKINQLLISAWINERFPSIIQIIEQYLRVSNLQTLTTVHNGRIVMCVVGTHAGTMDITRILVDIATVDRIEYDHSLENPIYELIKMHRVIGLRVRALMILLNQTNPIEELRQLSANTNTSFRVIRSND